MPRGWQGHGDIDPANLARPVVSDPRGSTTGLYRARQDADRTMSEDQTRRRDHVPGEETKSSPAERLSRSGKRGDRFVGPTYDPRHPGLRASWKNRSREVITMQEKTEKTTETREVTDAPGTDDAKKAQPETTGDDKDK